LKKEEYMRNLILLLIVALPLEILAQYGNYNEEPPERSSSPYMYVIGDSVPVGIITLTGTDVKASIIGPMADVTVSQVYENTGDETVEAIYKFPASVNAAVYAMKMNVNGKITEAKIMEKQKARETYETAKEEGKTASLLEMDGPNVFTMNVGNILPGDKIIIELRYTEFIEPEEKIYEFVFPTIIPPRYAGREEEPEENPGNTPPAPVSMDISLNSSIPMEFAESVHHEMSVREHSPHSADISSENIIPGEDFILRYKLAGDKIETGLLVTEGEKNFFMLTLQPPARVEQYNPPPREYIFVVDISGSMNGFPLSTSKKVIISLLKQLREKDKFNIILFAGSDQIMADKSLPGSPDNLKKAMDFINDSKSGGGTEIKTALRRALDLPASDKTSKTIMIFTDGHVRVERDVYQMIRESLGDANLFSFGIGSSVNRSIIEGMAYNGYGTSFYAYNAEEAPGVAEKFIKYVENPLLTDIELEFEGFDAYDYFPRSYPDMFAERPVVICGKFKGEPNGQIKITGFDGKDELHVDLPLSKFGRTDTSNSLKYFWARKQLKKISDYTPYDEFEKRKEEIVKISTKYNILSEFTSFVAVDDEQRIVENEKPEEMILRGYLDSKEAIVSGGTGMAALAAPNTYANSKISMRGSRAIETYEITLSSEYKEVEMLKGGFSAEYGDFAGGIVNDVMIVDNHETNYDRQPEIFIPDVNNYKSESEGIAVVTGMLDSAGNLSGESIFFSENDEVANNALSAISKGKFHPAYADANPVGSRIMLPFKFEKDNVLVDDFSGVVWRVIQHGSGSAISLGDNAKIRYKIISINSEIVAEGEFEFMYGIGEAMPAIELAMENMKLGAIRHALADRQKTYSGLPKIKNVKGHNPYFLIEIELLEINGSASIQKGGGISILSV
jgi:Ca-activated chloride channel family protein